MYLQSRIQNPGKHHHMNLFAKIVYGCAKSFILDARLRSEYASDVKCFKKADRVTFTCSRSTRETLEKCVKYV